jgi:hypothetical protein
MPGAGQEEHVDYILSNARLPTTEELNAIAKKEAETKRAYEIECAKNEENQRLYYAARERDQIERQEEKRFYSDFEKYREIGNNGEESYQLALKNIEERKLSRKVSKEQALALRVESAQQIWESKLYEYQTSLEEQLPLGKYDFHKDLETTTLEKLEQEYLLRKEEIYRSYLEKKLKLYQERIAYLKAEEDEKSDFHFLVTFEK